MNLMMAKLGVSLGLLWHALIIVLIVCPCTLSQQLPPAKPKPPSPKSDNSASTARDLARRKKAQSLLKRLAGTWIGKEDMRASWGDKGSCERIQHINRKIIFDSVNTEDLTIAGSYANESTLVLSKDETNCLLPQSGGKTAELKLIGTVKIHCETTSTCEWSRVMRSCAGDCKVDSDFGIDGGTVPDPDASINLLTLFHQGNGTNDPPFSLQFARSGSSEEREIIASEATNRKDQDQEAARAQDRRQQAMQSMMGRWTFSQTDRDSHQNQHVYRKVTNLTNGEHSSSAASAEINRSYTLTLRLNNERVEGDLTYVITWTATHPERVCCSYQYKFSNGSWQSQKTGVCTMNFIVAGSPSGDTGQINLQARYERSSGECSDPDRDPRSNDISGPAKLGTPSELEWSSSDFDPQTAVLHKAN